MKIKCNNCVMKCRLEIDADVSIELLPCFWYQLKDPMWILNQCPECESSNCNCQKRGM